MEKIFEIIKLTAKTGLMFANCDGVYSDREKDFIEGFIAGNSEPLRRIYGQNDRRTGCQGHVVDG